ncbi:MAG: hypothetical protein FWE16_01065 [Firmicutes bacterium]|nr:hypothetical protein [Bacillota bacterium]
MNKEQFLAQLNSETGDNELVRYYDELVSDRIEAGEDENTVVASYDVQKIARSAGFEIAKKELHAETQNRRGGRAWIVILALCSVPITIPLAIAFIAIMISFFAVALGLVGGAIGGLVMGAAAVVEMIIIGESASFILLSLGAYLVALAILWILGVLFVRALIIFYNWIVVRFFKFRRAK